jgi:mono/diheme cytochrome c family protein
VIKPMSRPWNRPLACLFLSSAALASAQTVTFNRQIAPIIYNNCASCHRPGEAAPFSLLSYQDVAKRGRLIASVTQSRLMPPWKADVSSYAFKDERRLKDSDIALIQDWVKQGMPEGKTSDAPAPPKFASGWMLGEPDLVVEMPAAYHVPADGPDIYRNIALPLGLTEDKWITAIDMKPSARSVVHHVLYFADAAGKAHQMPPQGSEPGFSGMRPGGAEAEPLGGWAVGAQPHFFPDGLALPLKKGSDFVVQYHFHPTGKPETEKSVIGFYFAKKPPERTLVAVQLPPTYSLFSGLDIPAGEKDFVIRDSYTLPAALDAVSIGAHAHYIGKQLKMTATLPGGEVKTLIWIKDWDFSWQDRYYFAEPVSLPKGTRLDAEVHWDNSAANPRNPSEPPIEVKWGEQSKDEMGSLSLVGVPHDESDLPVLRADLLKHRAEMARERLQRDAWLRAKLRELLAQ